MITTYLKNYLLLGCLALSLFSCKNSTSTHRTVTVSILPQKFLVERIAGDYLQVNVMIPPGMNPATCDLSTEQLKKLYNSDICFTIGYLPFEETHLYPVLQKREDIRVVNHSENIKLLSGGCGHQHEHCGVDPHIWVSPAHARTMATTIRQTLSEQYPEQKEQFEKNYNTLLAEIDSVDRKARELFTTLPGQAFLIYHPALTYFAADYGLQQISIEDEGKEPNPAHLKEIIDTAKEKNIRLIFIQNQFDVNNAQAIATEIGGTIVPIDPLGENWTEEMEKIINAFRPQVQ